MTKPGLNVRDNDGRCESCDDPATVGQQQSGYPVLLGGGLGWGKMWLCHKCLAEHKSADERVACAEAAWRAAEQVLESASEELKAAKTARASALIGLASAGRPS